MLVFAALLMLFAFFDLIHELGDLARAITVCENLWLCPAFLPGHVYELFPIATLIVPCSPFRKLTAHSELTVMRVSGLSAQRIALSLAKSWIAVRGTDPSFSGNLLRHLAGGAQELR